MKLLDFIVCDEVRVENTGKHFLVGVYSNELIVAAPPNLPPPPIRMSFFIRLKAEERDPIKQSLDFSIWQGSEKLFDLQGQVEIKNRDAFVNLGLNIGLVQVKRYGDIRFEMKYGDKVFAPEVGLTIRSLIPDAASKN
jgi:hypothetical protein